MPERPRRAASGRRHIRMRRRLVIAGVVVVTGGAAAGAVAASNHGGGNGGPASDSASACSAAMAFWQPRAAAALRGTGTGTDAGSAQDAASASGPAAAPQDGIFLTMLGSIALQALRYDLPPPCAPLLHASFRVSMSDFVQASADASRHDPRGAMTKLSAGPGAQRPVIAALTPAG
jgi:hypothetical protein